MTQNNRSGSRRTALEKPFVDSGRPRSDDAMPENTITDRRSFLRSAAVAGLAGTTALGSATAAGAGSPIVQQQDEPKQDVQKQEMQEPATDSVSLKGRVFKSLKINMVNVEGSLSEKFVAAKNAGFDAIEPNSPGMNVEETLKAISDSGLPVDGTVCSTHWNITHTSADQKIRDQALEDLRTAIRDTRAVGGSTVLLVVGKGSDGDSDEIWKRSVDNVARAIPDCARHGISIVVENVWNQFMYDHGGDNNQSADLFARYIDELNSPFVGMQFDIGNHHKYGNMADWIRQLGRRIYKLDVKGYSREIQDWAAIGDGDIDWSDVRRALHEINFHGYAAAEVGGGGADRLLDISQRLDRVFGL